MDTYDYVHGDGKLDLYKIPRNMKYVCVRAYKILFFYRVYIYIFFSLLIYIYIHVTIIL